MAGVSDRATASDRSIDPCYISDPLKALSSSSLESYGSADTEYICSEDLKPLDCDAQAIVTSLLEQLDSKDWVYVCDALMKLRQLAIFHSSFMLPILGPAVDAIIKALKNPRSALCKSAIMASTDLFKAYGDQMLDHMDALLLQLLLKASQDKRFVCEEAERALIGMTTWLSPALLLQRLHPFIGHRNPRVRAKASMCVRRSVSKLGVQGIMDFGVETLIQMGASQLNDQLPEAREAARQLVMDIREAYNKQFLTASLGSTPCLSSPSSSSSSSLSPSVSSSASSSSLLSSHNDNDPSNLPNLEISQEKWEQFCKKQLPPRTALAVLRVTCVAN